MDAERFGKALGTGVRATAKALKTAAGAAAAPNPRPFTHTTGPSSAAGQAGRTVARGVVQGKVTAAGVKRGSKRFGEAIWGPAARAGGVLWFEVTGSFFGLFALTAGFEVWRRRFDFLTGGQAREKACFAAAMLLAFGWFTLSSFAKARQRARQSL